MNFNFIAVFFVASLLYASVGFGGGSTYTALLAVSGVSYLLVPIISLFCNIAVVTGNSVRYGRSGYIRVKHTLPFLILSIPAAWIGGNLRVSERVFVGLLSAALLFAGLRLIFAAMREKKPATIGKDAGFIAPAIIGGAIGFLSGIVGIGGGVFLAPVLYFIRWGNSLQISAACSLFILVNSLAGLAGHLSKKGGLQNLNDALNYWPLLIAVIVGGAIGNAAGIKLLSEGLIRKLTGALVLAVGLRLLWKWWHITPAF